MNIEKLVDDYILVWNKQDVAELLGLMDTGASYYDAFWMETCSGKDLWQYFSAAFRDENYWYKQTDDLIAIDSGVVFRYSAHERTNSRIGQQVYQGAEVLIIIDSKIVTVSDHYCNPGRSALVEAGNLAAKRHGQTRYATSGFSASREAHFRRELKTKLNTEKMFLDPELTLAKLSGQIGCSSDYLSDIINTEFGADFRTVLNKKRAEFAKELLNLESADPGYLSHVAIRAGFRSVTEFKTSFSKAFGVEPEDFGRHCIEKFEPNDKHLMQ